MCSNHGVIVAVVDRITAVTIDSNATHPGMETVITRDSRQRLRRLQATFAAVVQLIRLPLVN